MGDMKNQKLYVFGLIMCIELVIVCISVILGIFWIDTMNKFVFTVSIPIIGFVLITIVSELLYRIYTNNQILSLKNQENKDKSPEEMISLEMAFNRSEGNWIALAQYFWITCMNLYAVFSLNGYYVFIGAILAQIALTLFFGFYLSTHSKKCYCDGMLTQSIYYAKAYQTLCKELIEYAKEDVIDTKTKDKTVKELHNDI